ncbi:MAG: 2-aminoethylphosphonate aminotransferase [Synoicihabitans sp.]
MILLNPGPVSMTPRVRAALAGEDLCHREPECNAMLRDIRHRLNHVYSDSHDRFESILLTGSGTAAVEAMLATLAPRESRTLVLCNGVYGERMAGMLNRQGKPVETLTHSWTSPWDLKAIETLLDQTPTITHLAAVHHETTTGRLNDLVGLSKMADRRGLKILLDAVSSFAGEEIAWRPGSLEAVAATANKCVHGAPGVSFVLVDKSRLATGSSQSPSLYLDLLIHHAAQSAESSAFTPAVHVYRALQVALMELEETGGWRQRHARYRHLSLTLREHLVQHGLSPLIPIHDSAATLTSFSLPPAINHRVWHEHLKRHGFVIYGGQGELAEKVFRIANMGAITDADWQRLFDVIKNQLQKSHP